MIYLPNYILLFKISLKTIINSNLNKITTMYQNVHYGITLMKNTFVNSWLTFALVVDSTIYNIAARYEKLQKCSRICDYADT